MTLALVLALLCGAPADAPNMVAPESTLSQDDPAYLLGKGLRCPVCQGMSIAESPSTMAQDMMKRVRGMLAEGQTPEQVNAYFIDRYGEWVLLAPPAGGFGFWVWALPPLFVLGAAAMLVRWVKRLRAGKEAAVETASVRVAGSGPASEASYLQEIRDEVQR